MAASWGERIRDLLQGMPVDCGLTVAQIAQVLEAPSLNYIRNCVQNEMEAGVIRPLPGYPLRWRRTLVAQQTVTA